MADKRDIVKELFIKLGLVGAKEIKAEIERIVNSMSKMEESTGEVGDSLESTSEKTKESTNALKKMGDRLKNLVGERLQPFGDALKTVGRRFTSFANGVRSAARLVARALNTLFAPIRGLLNLTSGLRGSLGRIFEFAAGNLLAQGINNVASAFKNLATSAVSAAISEEEAVYRLREALFLTRQYTQQLEKDFTGLAGQLQKSLGIDADLILTGIARTIAGGVEAGDIPRVTRQAAYLAEVSGRDILTILEQIKKALTTGNIEEGITSIVPELKKLTKNADGTLNKLEVLDTIDRTLGSIGEFQNTSLAKELQRLGVAFSEFLKTAGRPIAGVLKYFVQKLTPLLNLFASRNILTYLGTGIGRAIATIFNLFPLDAEQLAAKIQQYSTAIGQAIQFLTLAFVDIFKFIFRMPSLLGKYLQKAGYEQTILGLIKYLIGAIVNSIATAIKESELVSGITKFFLFGNDKQPRTPPENFEEFKERVKKNPPSKLFDSLKGFGMLNFGNDLFQTKSSIPPQSAVNNNSSIIFNNAINISTQQPVNAIQRQLQSQGMLAANMGRRS